MKTNKQIIAELTEYFLTQDPKIVARLLANAMIDYNRLSDINFLDENEFKILQYRISENAKEVRKFAKYGPDGNLKAISAEDEL